VESSCEFGIEPSGSIKCGKLSSVLTTGGASPSGTQLRRVSYLKFGCLHPVACIRSASHVNFRCIYFHLKMIVQPKDVVDSLNKIVNNY
jgi:hypothetical protein